MNQWHVVLIETFSLGLVLNKTGAKPAQGHLTRKHAVQLGVNIYCLCYRTFLKFSKTLGGQLALQERR